MKFTVSTLEQDVIKYLQERYAHLDDISARSILSSAGYLRKRHKGKGRSKVDVAIHNSVARRPEGTSIDEALENQLSENEKIGIDNRKRTFFRQTKRTHVLLDPFRSYNEEDFCDAILGKQFHIAAAIFETCEKQAKRKIVVFLNRHYRHFAD